MEMSFLSLRFLMPEVKNVAQKIRVETLAGTTLIHAIGL